jgi:transcriptional regulator
MYTPAAFAESRADVVHALMGAHPFATVIVQGEGGLVANHLPMEWTDGRLQGHVARGNELASFDGASVLAIFHGPDGYVSPNWYPSKRETGREVPTWNYAVAHVHGRLRVTQDAAWLRALLERLTDRFEASEPAPWRVRDAPADHVEKLLGAISGIEITVDRIDAKFKLNQNHPAANRAGVIAGLHRRGAQGDAALADLMTFTFENPHLQDA